MAYHEPLELVVCFGEDLDPRQRNGTEVSRAELGTEYRTVYEFRFMYVVPDIVGWKKN